MTKIHPTAIVSPDAEIDEDVELGPYAVVGDHVVIGKGTRVGAHVVLEGHTVVGQRCHFFTGAVVGSIPQDLKYKGEVSHLRIGNDNIIREYVTINPGTQGGGGQTVIGDENLVMAYAHIAHDCIIANKTILANAATLAGHVVVEDRVIVGGLVAVHQFVRIGQLAIIGGCSKVVQDVPPYSICDGHPAQFRGVNLVGLERAGTPTDTIDSLKQVYRIFYRMGLSKDHALEKIIKEAEAISETQEVIRFIQFSTRGICRGYRRKESEVIDSVLQPD